MKNKKLLWIIGGIVLLIVLCVVCLVVLVSAGVLQLSSWFMNTAAVVEYNNDLVTERDKIVEQVYEVSYALDYATSLDEITQENETLDEIISSVESTINDTAVPSGADELKEMNLEYIALCKKLVTAVDNAIKASGSGGDVQTYIQEYNDTLNKMDELNEAIARKLNEVVGYDAVTEEQLLDY
jgi:hypothetical protein